MDLFSLVFNGISPYLFAIAKLMLAIGLFSCFLKVMRSRGGSSVGSNSGVQSAVQVFVGYMLCRGIPLIVQITDNICNEILKNMGG